MSGAEVFGNWLFQVPNLLLAAMMYTLLGRFVLSFIFKPDSKMVFWSVFVQITQPVINLVRHVTPLIISDKFVILLAFAWMLFLRILLVISVFLLAAK